MTEDGLIQHASQDRRPWVTIFSSIVCVLIFIGTAVQGEYDSWEAVSKFGYIDAGSIREGALWGLVTSAFVHYEIWHIAFNVYWLWVLGRAIETAIGSTRFAVFFVLAAFVSSAAQLALTDDTGIGASGVGYAMFGFMWLARDHYARFNEVLDQRTIRVFLVWLCACIVVTYFGILNVANAAHIGGLAFGGGVAIAFVLRVRARLSLAALVVLSATSVFWAPWSFTWLCQAAVTAENKGQDEKAIELYGKAIGLEPTHRWAYLRRYQIHVKLGQIELAREYYGRARVLDPTLDEWN